MKRWNRRRALRELGGPLYSSREDVGLDVFFFGEESHRASSPLSGETVTPLPTRRTRATRRETSAVELMVEFGRRVEMRAWRILWQICEARTAHKVTGSRIIEAILLGLTVPCRQLRRRRSPAIPDFSPLGRSPVTRVFPLLYPTNAFETRLGFSLHRAIKL